MVKDYGILFVNTNRCIPVKIRLGRNEGVFCACQIIQLFPLVMCIIRVAHTFFFGFIINEIPNKWRPVERRSLQ